MQDIMDLIPAHLTVSSAHQHMTDKRKVYMEHDRMMSLNKVKRIGDRTPPWKHPYRDGELSDVFFPVSRRGLDTDKISQGNKFFSARRSIIRCLFMQLKSKLRS